MISAIGSSALLVSLFMAVLGVGLAIVGVHRRRVDLVNAAYAAVYTNLALLTIANGAMIYALVARDFSVS